MLSYRRHIAVWAFLIVLCSYGRVPAAETGKLIVELNKFEEIEKSCRAFFLFRNGTRLAFESFELSLAVLDGKGVIQRLLTLEAAPLPAERTTLKLFEIPDTQCEQIGEIILHDIAKCEATEGQSLQCFDVVELRSLAITPFVK